MASLNKNNGGWRIRFTDDGTEKSFYPGKMPKKNAQQVKAHIEALVSARQSGTATPLATATWLNECGEEFRAKLYKLSLIEKPSEQSSHMPLEALCERFMVSRSEIKDSTRLIWKRCKDALYRCFDESARIDGFTPGDAKDFRELLLKEGKAEATVRKMSAVAAQIFTDAVEREELDKNPFRVKGVPRSSQANRKRDHYHHSRGCQQDTCVLPQ